jgi:hypothetical protein
MLKAIHAQDSRKAADDPSAISGDLLATAKWPPRQSRHSSAA